MRGDLTQRTRSIFRGNPKQENPIPDPSPVLTYEVYANTALVRPQSDIFELGRTRFTPLPSNRVAPQPVYLAHHDP